MGNDPIDNGDQGGFVLDPDSKGDQVFGCYEHPPHEEDSGCEECDVVEDSDDGLPVVVGFDLLGCYGFVVLDGSG